MKRLLCVLLAVLIICSCWVTAGAAEDGTTAPEDKSSGWVYDDQYNLPTQATEYTAGSGTITWEPTTVYDAKFERYKAVSGRLTLNNASISVDAAAKKGIWVPVDTELVLIGNNTITMSQSGTAIMITDRFYGGTPSLTIRGEGSLTVNANGGGDGMEVRNEINIVEEANVSINCSNGVGMFTTAGGINISDSTVKVRIADNASSRGAIRAVINGDPTADITIENSHVTAINPGGLSMKSSGSISFTDSDVVAIGHSTLYNNIPSEGILAFAELSGGTINISGGTLYAENKYDNPQNYNTGFDLPINGKITATNSAVLYYYHKYRQLVSGKDNIEYLNCRYDEYTDRVTTIGNGYVMGTVEWNGNFVFGTSNTGIYNYNKSASNITVPSGTTVTIPKGNGVYNPGTITNNGTMVVEGTLQNLLSSTVSESTGTIINNGTINIKAQGDARSTGTVLNNGTINIEGIYYNYPSGKINGGTINGVILEYNASASPKQFFFVAHGNAELYENDVKYMGNKDNTLLVGTDSTSDKKQTMTVPTGTELTIHENCTLDASQSTLGLSWKALDTYLSVKGKIVVNGTLKLPPDPVQEKLDELLTHITGTGQVIIGESTAYPVTVTGCTADKSFAVQGETVTLTPGVSAQGTRFLRWETSSGVTVGEDNTFTMPNGTVTVTAIYSHTVTFNTQGGRSGEPGRRGRPGGSRAGGSSHPRWVRF